eukprot:3360269-Prymnesium_polylepis.1
MAVAPAVAPVSTMLLIRIRQLGPFFCVAVWRHWRSEGLAISMRASCHRLRASRRRMAAARATSSGWIGGGAPSGAAGRPHPALVRSATSSPLR